VELLSTGTVSPVYEDHDYVCCRGSKVVTIDNDQNRRTSVHAAAGGPDSKPASRAVNSFWKMGHDTRRKLCIVGFNWKSSPLRLHKLDAAKTAATSASSPAVDGRMKPKDKSARSKVVLTSCESISGAETTTRTLSGVSCDGAEVVKESGTKRRSKVYIYKPAPPADCGGSRATTAKPVALANKLAGEKVGNSNTVMSAVSETRAAVESIIVPDDFDRETIPELSVPLLRGLPHTAGEYTIHLSSTDRSNLASTKSASDCGYLSAMLRKTGNGIPPGCEATSTVAVSPHEVVGGEVASAALSTAPFGIPSPFLLQTGLEQALGFAAFHPMSPSTSSSSCSRVAGDDWINDDDDPTALHSVRVGTNRAPRSSILTPDSWIGCVADARVRRGKYDERTHSSGSTTNPHWAEHGGLLPASEPEAVFFDDLPAPFSDDGDLRYQSSSFVVCEDSWDGYQREEQIDDSWSHHSVPFGFGRKSAASRFRFTDTGVITSLGGEGSSFGRADRRRKQPEEKRNRKSMYDVKDDVIVVAGGDGPEAVSASKKSCRQRLKFGEGAKGSATSTTVDRDQTEVTTEGDGVDTAQKTPSNRRRKLPVASRKKSAATAENSFSDASDGTPKTEGASKRRAHSKTSRGQLDANIKTPHSAVRLINSF